MYMVTAALKEDLTIASGESIEFESGASITNPEKLTLADGASLLVDGEEHTHNKDGDVTYTWKDDKEHIKKCGMQRLSNRICNERNGISQHRREWFLCM